MHVLDSKITEIEERIEEVIKYAPQQEGTTMQETVLSYGWILLDSWVAWRTLRFLLRGVSTIEQVQEKWLQTPSSYSSAQLGAVWGFKDITAEYFNSTMGRDGKGIFNELIQKKRNASAHFSPKTSDADTNISGSDTNVIQMLYKGLSTAFLFYESMAFWKDVQALLAQRGYGKLKVLIKDATGEEKEFGMDSIDNALPTFNKNSGYRVVFNNEENRSCMIIVKSNYCKIGFSSDSDEKELQEGHFLKAEDGKYYNLLDNKGYYVHIAEFVQNIDSSLHVLLNDNECLK